ncbi:MAG: DNA alkylation repair protein [Candidatus Aminicenantes bacterium]|nr:DNA alkylation repair protein [Candidatus Aminicenantes bacterium]
MTAENKIVQDIRKELQEKADEKTRLSSQRFFKKEEEIKMYGVRTPVFREINENYFAAIKDKPKQEIFSLGEKLLESGYLEELGVAFDWAFRIRKGFEKKDFSLLESWLKKYVTNWGACDSFCIRALGYFIYKFPEYFSEVKKWAVSKNRWVRRASAVVLIYSIRKKKPLTPVFEIADILLLDEDDMVQKGYGWMLKVASDQEPKRVFDYVMKHKKIMPRTALRYAIEKLSPDLRKQAMARE